MKPPVNPNYAATVVKIKTLTPLEGCDNVVGTPIFGFQAIVSKDTKVGDLGIVFPAETQLSKEYARANNLHRHGDLNHNKEAKGYLEDNRRIKAMKFRGHRSDALFMPLESLQFAIDTPTFLAEGDIFDELDGHEICRKYTRPVTHATSKEKREAQKFIRVDKQFLPEHYDSENYFRNHDRIDPGSRIVVTQKLHGTSIRVGNTIVSRRLSWLERLARRAGARVADTEFDYIFGSRKVIKDANNPAQNHYYKEDIWTHEGKKLEGLIPENFLVYGELIGYTPSGAPIQKNYTYDLPVGQCALYVYRVAFVNGQGKIVDLAWEQVKEFCRDAGLKHVPELWVGEKKNFNVEQWLDKKFAPMAIPVASDSGFMDMEDLNVVPLSPESPCDEGVCVRVDGMIPYILKAKSPMFLQHETKMLDEEAADIEVEGSVDG